MWYDVDVPYLTITAQPDGMRSLDQGKGQAAVPEPRGADDDHRRFGAAATCW
jgi:hypothetical protein